MDSIFVLDFGGQYCHLIVKRLRNFGVYAEILSASTSANKLASKEGIKGIILSGGAMSVYDKTSPKFDKNILTLGIPVLGICYGHQLLAQAFKGKVVSGKSGEYGPIKLKINSNGKLLEGISKLGLVWMNHKDVVRKLPADCKLLASTSHSPIAAFECLEKHIYGVQFHPEVTHTEKGDKILKNFAFNICGAKSGWKIADISKDIINETKATIGDKKVIIGLSGGIDSSVAAALISEAVGKNLTAVYVDTGLMRHKETEYIKRAFLKTKLNLKIVNAKNDFFRKLKNVRDPEQKRKIIGKLFVDIFTKIAEKENADFLIQGTIYSDRIESGITKHSSKIKSHHNVGGLPKRMKLKVYEPLRNLYKDEVKNIARQLKLPKEIVERQVFPGPGLAVRIIGTVTPKKIEIVRNASHMIEEELKKVKLHNKVWMSFAVLLSVKSVGIQGDSRSYKYPVVVRIIESTDAMTANFAKIPYKVLESISSRITNEIKEVNRVVYDISNKPPATMEWE